MLAFPFSRLHCRGNRESGARLGNPSVVAAKAAEGVHLNAPVDPGQPTLAIVPSNPAPAGASVGMFETGDKVKLRYATFPKGEGPARGTICLVQGRTEFIEK